MRVLLTDGSGLTARQVANRLSASGHVVEALTPDSFCLCRFTRHVRRLRHVPAYGLDPFAWLDAALAAYEDGEFDVLFPTQEQVAALASVPQRLQAAGVVTAVPPWAALLAVQDKVSAFVTLQRLGVPQPPATTDPAGWDSYPAFVKVPIGTASGGVVRVSSAEQLAKACAGRTEVLVQLAVDGPLAMCQSVFDDGSLVAFHANLRTGEGANGGASRKCSIASPEARDGLETLGRALRWHGALSADVIVTSEGPQFIDINPRLVEPENAWRAGVDLVGVLLAVAHGSRPAPSPDGRAGVKTHQLLLAVLGAAQQGRGRGAVLGELAAACRHSGAYAGSTEELTPLRGDPPGILPLVMASLATLVRPASSSWFTSGSVENYVLSPDGWERIVSVAGDQP
jgi:predicted ATP-grasp superfamily ATP-dependent carboligase